MEKYEGQWKNKIPLWAANTQNEGMEIITINLVSRAKIKF